MPSPREISLALLNALSSGGDFAELFLEDRRDMTIRCAEGSVGGSTSLHIHGAGIHLLKGAVGVYAHSNDTSREGLLRLAARAAELLSRALASESRGSPARPLDLASSPLRYPTPIPVRIWPHTVEAQRKVRALKEMDAAAREEGGVRSLAVNYFDTRQHILVANSEGLYVEDERVRTRARVDATVEAGSECLFEFDDFVGPCGFELFEGDSALFARSQIASMKARLRARPVASCVVPVVIEGGSGGVLWHEACGHPLEAENLAAGMGEFAGKFGQLVASPKVSLIDDG
ncbi:MAG: metallopeptidase TldD-related protein, partial [Spirochaetaceae bacterium]|nr:metallopeptidase TldD-related protein [Spirochaetaceae bacterium]